MTQVRAEMPQLYSLYPVVSPPSTGRRLRSRCVPEDDGCVGALAVTIGQHYRASQLPSTDLKLENLDRLLTSKR